MEPDPEALAKTLREAAEKLQEAEERQEEEPKMEERYNRARGGATLLEQSSDDATAILEALKAQKKKREDAATAVADEASAEEKDLADAEDVDAVTLCIEFLELHTETIAPTALADLAAAQEKAASLHAFAKKQTVKLEERRAKVTEQEASLRLAQEESAGKIERLQAELERARAKPKEVPRDGNAAALAAASDETKKLRAELERAHAELGNRPREGAAAIAAELKTTPHARRPDESDSASTTKAEQLAKDDHRDEGYSPVAPETLTPNQPVGKAKTSRVTPPSPDPAAAAPKAWSPSTAIALATPIPSPAPTASGADEQKTEAVSIATKNVAAPASASPQQAAPAPPPADDGDVGGGDVGVMDQPETPAETRGLAALAPTANDCGLGDAEVPVDAISPQEPQIELLVPEKLAALPKTDGGDFGLLPPSSPPVAREHPRDDATRMAFNLIDCGRRPRGHLKRAVRGASQLKGRFRAGTGEGSVNEADAAIEAPILTQEDQMELVKNKAARALEAEDYKGLALDAMLRLTDQRGDPPEATDPQKWVNMCLGQGERAAVRNARDFEIGVPIVREHARQIARALAKEKSDQAVTFDDIMKVLKQAAPKGYGPTKEDPYLVASFALYVSGEREASGGRRALT